MGGLVTLLRFFSLEDPQTWPQSASETLALACQPSQLEGQSGAGAESRAAFRVPHPPGKSGGSFLTW